MMKNRMIASTGTESNLTVYGLNVFKGRKLFDIRKCYKNAENEIVHTKKGISLNENSFSILLKLLTQESNTIEDWLDQEYETKIDFEIDDALNKLEKLELMSQDKDGILTVVSLDKALEKMDYIWDNFFDYNKS